MKSREPNEQFIGMFLHGAIRPDIFIVPYNIRIISYHCPVILYGAAVPMFQCLESRASTLLQIIEELSWAPKWFLDFGVHEPGTQMNNSNLSMQNDEWQADLGLMVPKDGIYSPTDLLTHNRRMMDAENSTFKNRGSPDQRFYDFENIIDEIPNFNEGNYFLSHFVKHLSNRFGFQSNSIINVFLWSCKWGNPDVPMVRGKSPGSYIRCQVNSNTLLYTMGKLEFEVKSIPPTTPSKLTPTKLVRRSMGIKYVKIRITEQAFDHRAFYVTRLAILSLMDAIVTECTRHMKYINSIIFYFRFLPRPDSNDDRLFVSLGCEKTIEDDGGMWFSWDYTKCESADRLGGFDVSPYKSRSNPAPSRVEGEELFPMNIDDEFLKSVLGRKRNMSSDERMSGESPEKKPRRSGRRVSRKKVSRRR